MRVPWFIVVISSILVLGGGLYLGSKDKSFTKEPTPKELSEAVLSWQSSHPKLPKRQSPLPELPPESNTVAPAILPPHTHNEESKQTVPTGDLTVIPGLDHFSQFGENNSQLRLLATQLQEKGHLNHALLAWERILDTFPHSKENQSSAYQKIHVLRDSTAPWNIDPSHALSITIHITVPKSHAKVCTPVFQLLSAAIEDASDYTVTAKVLINQITQREGLPTPPISLWCSANGNETPRLSFQILKTTPKALAEQAQRKLYQLIQQYTDQNTALVPPAPIPEAQTPGNALRLQITRLTWKTFAESLSNASNVVPVAIPIVE